MNVTIKYNQDLVSGNNIEVFVEERLDHSTFILTSGDVEYKENKINQLIFSIKQNLNRYNYILEPENIHNWFDDIIKDNSHNSTFRFLIFPKVFCKVLNMGDVNKYSFSFGNGESIFYVVGELDNTLFSEMSARISEELEIDAEVDDQNFKMMIEHKKNDFVVVLDISKCDAEVESGIVLEMSYNTNKNKYCMMYKTSRQLVDIVSITSGTRIDGFEKFEKVVESFEKRVFVLDKEEIIIHKKKTTYDKILTFNERYVKSKTRDDKNYIIKKEANILGLVD